jgi:hypothetical protein
MNSSTANALLVRQVLAQFCVSQQQQTQAMDEIVSIRAQQQQQQLDPSPLVTFLQQNSAHNAQRSSSSAQQMSQQEQSRVRTIPRRSASRMLNEREELLMFIKILFRFLKENRDEYRLLQAKAIVAECTRRNRVGDGEFMHLKRAVEPRLRRIVGELYWARTRDYLNGYCQRRGIRQAPLVSAV